MTDASRNAPPTPEVQQELQDDFALADADQDGYIDLGEFTGLMDDLGAELSATDLRIGFQEIDSDRDGRINLGEFIAWWTQA